MTKEKKRSVARYLISCFFEQFSFTSLFVIILRLLEIPPFTFLVVCVVFYIWCAGPPNIIIKGQRHKNLRTQQQRVNWKEKSYRVFVYAFYDWKPWYLNGVRVQVAIVVFNMICDQTNCLHSSFATMFSLINKKWLNRRTTEFPATVYYWFEDNNIKETNIYRKQVRIKEVQEKTS